MWTGRVIMTRSDTDSWDLASSVGATATMVAAARALATEDTDPIINDPFAAPLVRAVGIDFFTRVVDGEIDPGRRRRGRHHGTADRNRLAGGAHPVLRRVLHQRGRGGHRSGRDPGRRPGRQGLPAGLAGRQRRLRSRPTSGRHVQNRDHGSSLAPNRRRSAARSASTCARTGRLRCATAVLTTPSRRPGAPRGC